MNIQLLSYFILPTFVIIFFILSLVSIIKYVKQRKKIKSEIYIQEQIKKISKIVFENDLNPQLQLIAGLEHNEAVDVINQKYTEMFFRSVLPMLCSVFFVMSVSYCIVFPGFIYGTKAYRNEIKKDSAWAERNKYSAQWKSIGVEQRKYQYGTPKWTELESEQASAWVQYEKAQAYYESLP